MARTDSLEHFLTDAAAAIRLKCGTSAQMNPNEMIDTINSTSLYNVNNYTNPQLIDIYPGFAYRDGAKSFFDTFPQPFLEHLNKVGSYKINFYDFRYAHEDDNFNAFVPKGIVNSLNFAYCAGIKNLNLCLWNFNSTVNNMNFCNCFQLSSLTFSDAIKNINSLNFSDCHNLQLINNFNNKIPSNLAHVFYNCYNLDFNFLLDWNLQKINNLFVAFESSNFQHLNIFNNRSMDIQNVVGAFNNTKISIPDNCVLNFWNCNYCGRMFHNCKYITDAHFQEFNICLSSNVVEMFSNCENLISFSFDGWDINNTNSLSNMFYNCYNLTHFGGITFAENGIPKKITNLSYMFYNCCNLYWMSQGTWLQLLRGGKENINNITKMFYNCNNLEPTSLAMFIELVIDALNIEAFPAAQRNLNNKNTYSPFSGSNINLNNSDYVIDYLVGEGGFNGDVISNLTSKGWKI